MIKVDQMLLVFKRLLFSRKSKAMTFSSSLVIYSLMSYIIYLSVFGQTFISIESTKMQLATYEETASKRCFLKYVLLEEGNIFNTAGKIFKI